MDEFYMKRAIELAKNGVGWVNPNPLVGAVIVKDGKIIGEGYHKKYGELHAEREALASATEDVKGSTMYVTLEPCCHYGKQPPCTQAIIEAGIKRVVIGSYDANPLVSGKGIEMLKNAGVEVEDKLICNEECKALNYVFFNYIKEKKPYVIVKYAQTLDGKIATYTGKSRWITGEAAREQVHRDRHRYSAIMVGVQTVINDDPMLTCRSTTINNINQPLRVICDTNLRTPLNSKIVQSAKQYKALIATCCEDEKKIQAYKSAGCEVMVVPSKNIKKNGHTQTDIKAIMAGLGERGIDSVICEGGSKLNWSVIESGVVNRIQAYIAPVIFGGETALSAIGGIGFESPDKAIRLKHYNTTQLGEDILIEGELEKGW